MRSGSRNGRRQTPQPFADDDDDNLWGEGFVDFAFEPYFLFGHAQIFALASQALPWRRHTHTHRKTTNCLQYLLFATATVDNDETAT